MAEPRTGRSEDISPDDGTAGYMRRSRSSWYLSQAPNG